MDIEIACTDNLRKFWDHFRSLSPKRKHDIPLETYDDTGNVTSDHNTVSEKWSTDFSSLYDPENTEGHFDHQFYNEIIDAYFSFYVFILFAASAFRKLSSVYVFSYFPFGFEGRIWDLIVSVPDHCLSFYFDISFYLKTICLIRLMKKMLL